MATERIPVQCCVCRRVRVGEEWVELDGRLRRGYSHGYCPACQREALAEVEVFIRGHGPEQMPPLAGVSSCVATCR